MSGLLADSPAPFAHCSLLKSLPIESFVDNTKAQPYALTDMGLEIQIPLIIWSLDTYIGLLRCFVNGKTDTIGTFLSYRDGRYFRIVCKDASRIRVSLFEQDAFHRNGSVIYGRNVLISHGGIHEVKPLYGFRLMLDCNKFGRNDLGAIDILAHHWEPESGEVSIEPGTIGTVAVVFFNSIVSPLDSRKTAFFQLAFDGHFNPCCLVGYCYRRALSTLNPERCDMLQACFLPQSAPKEQFPKASWAQEDSGWLEASNWWTTKTTNHPTGGCAMFINDGNRWLLQGKG